MSEHAEHETVQALPADCWEGDCEHYLDEDGLVIAEDCPLIDFDVCLDCMEEADATRDPEYWAEWEKPLLPWPHPGSAGWTETPPEPEIFRESEQR